MEALEADFDLRLKNLQSATTVSDDSIRGEIKRIAQALEGQSVSRIQMTDLLIELGNRLKEDE